MKQSVVYNVLSIEHVFVLFVAVALVLLSSVLFNAMQGKGVSVISKPIRLVVHSVIAVLCGTVPLMHMSASGLSSVSALQAWGEATAFVLVANLLEIIMRQPKKGRGPTRSDHEHS